MSAPHKVINGFFVYYKPGEGVFPVRAGSSFVRAFKQGGLSNVVREARTNEALRRAASDAAIDVLLMRNIWFSVAYWTFNQYWTGRYVPLVGRFFGWQKNYDCGSGEGVTNVVSSVCNYSYWSSPPYQYSGSAVRDMGTYWQYCEHENMKVWLNANTLNWRTRKYYTRSKSAGWANPYGVNVAHLFPADPFAQIRISLSQAVAPELMRPGDPMADPVSRPYSDLAHQADYADTSEASERGYDVRTDSHGQYDVGSNPYFSDPLSNPFNPINLAPAEGYWPTIEVVANPATGEVDWKPPAKPPERPSDEPPQRQKERKQKIGFGGTAAHLALGTFTETLDLVSDLYDALPDAYKRSERCGRIKRSVPEKMAEIYKHYDQIDLGQALTNFAWSQTKDRAYAYAGKLQKRMAKATGQLHTAGFGGSAIRSAAKRGIDAQLGSYYSAEAAKQSKAVKRQKAIAEKQAYLRCRKARGL